MCFETRSASEWWSSCFWFLNIIVSGLSWAGISAKGIKVWHWLCVWMQSDQEELLQVIVLVPFGVQRVPHCVCWVALPWTVHHHLSEGVWQSCKIHKHRLLRLLSRNWSQHWIQDHLVHNVFWNWFETWNPRMLQRSQKNNNTPIATDGLILEMVTIM